jgi:hypothetical protein
LTIVIVAVVALAKMRSGINLDVKDSKNVKVSIDQSNSRGSINEDNHYSNVSQDE